MSESIDKFGDADVFDVEQKIISGQRQMREQSKSEKPLVGLALSGGGIRSASFAIGVLQGLDKCRMLKFVDYLSTVSGGGYSGSSLTWFSYLQGKEDKTKWEFPFGERGKGARSDPDKSNALDYLRLHGSYLTPGNGLSTLSLFAMILRSSVYSATVYLSLLVLLMASLHSLGLFDPLSKIEVEGFLSFLKGLNRIHLAAICVFMLSVGMVAGSAVLSLLPFASRQLGYATRVHQQRVYGWLLLTVLILLALGFLPYFLNPETKQKAAETLSNGGNQSSPQWQFLDLLPGGVSLVIGAGGAIYQFLFQRKPGAKASALSGLRIWITACLLIYGLFFAAYFIFINVQETEIFGLNALYWFAAVVVGGGLLINTNLFEINRMYRDRLMETFLPNPAAVEENRWQPASAADVAMMKDMCGDGALDDTSADLSKTITTRGPYHLVNTNIVLGDSDNARFRSRGGDNFVISPAFSGGDALGWFKTTDFLGGEMTLATAMSISGAALNPNTGVGGKGVSRNKLVAFMMGFLNIRLGFWVRNPSKQIAGQNSNKGFWPNLFYPGLFQGLLGRGLHEKARYIELTDGGHFDNTGLYELIRRKLPTIILSQAGADPEFNIGDIAIAIERARVDFGVVIRFDIDGLGLDGLIPGSSGNGGFSEKFQLAQRGFAVGNIDYPDGKTGTLFVVKSVLTSGLPAGLYHYKSVNMTFPNQTTNDQFFDESQFEAYRELGYQIVMQMENKLKREHFFEAFRES